MRANAGVVVVVVVGGLLPVASCKDSALLAREEPASTGGSSSTEAHVQPAAIGPMPPCTSGDCEPFLIARLPTSRGTGIAIDRGFAYVSTFFDNAIYRVALRPGATPALLYRSPGANLGDIEVHGDELRWSSNETGRIYAAPVSGTGPIRIIADTLPGIWGFASDDDWIYWADFGGSAPGTVWKKPLRGGPSEAIACDPSSQLVDHVLVRSRSGLLFTDQTARVLYSPTSGEATEVFLQVEGDLQSSGVAEDDTHVYVSSFTSGIVRMNKTTGEVELFVEDRASPAEVTVDATHVYWVDYTPVEVWGKRK